MAKRENRKDATLGRLPDTASFAQRMIKGKLKSKEAPEMVRPKLTLKPKKKLQLKRKTKKPEKENEIVLASQDVPLEFLDEEEEVKDIVPVMDSEPIFDKRKRTLRPKAAPMRNCDNCRFALSCQRFEEGAQCYYLPIFGQFKLENFDDLKDAFIALGEEQMFRTQESIIEEILSGGIGTGVADSQIAAAKQVLMELMQMFSPREKPQTSIIQQIFGVNITADGIAQTQHFVRPQIPIAETSSRSREQITIADHDSRREEQIEVADDAREIVEVEPIKESKSIPKIKELLGISHSDEEKALLEDSDSLSKNADMQRKLEEEIARREELERRLAKNKAPQEIPGIVDGSVVKE